jgi:very-short-patch-repair endonuclease
VEISILSETPGIYLNDSPLTLEQKVLVEIQGGIYQYAPSHTSASGIRRDAEKMNLAVSQGWKVYHFTPDMVRDGQALTMIEQEVK